VYIQVTIRGTRAAEALSRAVAARESRLYR